jgi:nucleotide-binding universal stress UspA family protein
MNVLVATDGSKYGQWGLNWVAKLPFVKQPHVTALHVLDSAWLRWPFRTRPEVQRMETHAANTLKRAKQRLRSLNLKGTARKEQGSVAQTILKRAPKRDGLLVVGSQGLDAFDRFMLGSVSTKLVQYATCPVLVVKSEAVPLRRIALATDGSEASAKALEFVVSTFRPDRATSMGGRAPIHVSVIHVIVRRPLAPITIGSTIPWVEYRERKVNETGRKLLEQSVQKLVEAGFTAEPLCQSGNPAERIMKGATKHHADLIVMGAKGLAAVDRFLLGSVSTRVVQHAKGSVLVVR